MNHKMRSRLSRLPAILGVVAATAALTACGSDASGADNGSGSSGSSSSSSSSSSSDPGVAKAKAELAKYQAAPTKITNTTPLKSPPPKGKTVVMLGTADPNNVIIQNGVKKLAHLVGWNYS